MSQVQTPAVIEKLEQLVPQELLNAPAKHATEESFKMVAKQGAFLPRLQLCGASSDVCKKMKIGMGRYAIVQGKDTIEVDLTEQFNCIVLAWRPKALRIDGADTKAFYNPGSETFKQVQEESNQKVMGSLYGPEFLVYVPDAPENSRFANMFFGNPTMRRQAPFMRSLLGKAATCKVELIEKKHTWHGPVILGCTSPLNIPASGTPERDALYLMFKENVDKFNKPPEEEVEAAPEDGTPARAR